MQTDLLNYSLPANCIAQTPTQKRDGSRLLVVNRRTGRIEHHRFSDFPQLLPADCTLFRNNAAVFKARLQGKRPTGGAVECLLLNPEEGQPQKWRCLLKPGKRLQEGKTFGCKDAFCAKVLQKAEDGSSLVEFDIVGGKSVQWLCSRYGSVPLPPYLERSKATCSEDEQRYQTVYASEDKPVAAAAPTAGLHFTPELFAQLQSQGVSIYDLTLHVGLGTFRPIEADQLQDHSMHKERYELSASACSALLSGAKRPLLAIGTTTVRCIEDFTRRIFARSIDPQIAKEQGLIADADLFLYPPSFLHGVDYLLTNFHLPRSTLLCLVATFLTPGEMGGLAWLKAIYAEAIRRNYRFFSYGDAMLIL